eukprot:6202417-Pleurochrysis_carterae.AAC.4
MVWSLEKAVSEHTPESWRKADLQKSQEGAASEGGRQCNCEVSGLVVCVRAGACGCVRAGAWASVPVRQSVQEKQSRVTLAAPAESELGSHSAMSQDVASRSGARRAIERARVLAPVPAPVPARWGAQVRA